MGTDEKLREIINFIENVLKKGKTYLVPDYPSLCGDYVSDDIVRSYRNKLQCFRHATDQDIEKRNAFTDAQKDFLIDFGIVIVKVTYSLVKENAIVL